MASRHFRATKTSIGVLSLSAGIACSSHPQGPPPLPEAVVLRFDRVAVSPTKPGTSERWDGGEPEDSGAACAMAGLGATWAWSPHAGGAVGKVCEALTRSSESERKSEDPDLEL